MEVYGARASPTFGVNEHLAARGTVVRNGGARSLHGTEGGGATMKFTVVRTRPQTRSLAGPYTVLLGIGAGLAAMYLFDPARGRGRRILLEQRTAKELRHGRSIIGKASRDLINRASGVLAEATTRSGEVADDILEARVRSAIGRVVSHPRAVTVSCDEGMVTLSGHVLAHEAEALLATTNRIRGVKEVNSALEIHQGASHVPSLQGRGRTSGTGLLARASAPGPRLALIVSGLALGFYGLIKRGVSGYFAVGAGALLVSSAKWPSPARLRHPTIDAQRSITVNAPVDEAFGMWCDFERFPQFMSHVKQVVRTGENSWHWVVDGPAGVSIEWDSEVTRTVPNKVIAWSGIGSAVATSGLAHFSQVAPGQTRIDVYSQWQPAAGVAGRAVALLFGRDPDQLLRDDLARFKARVERTSLGLPRHSHP